MIPHLEVVLWEEYRGNKKTKVRELERSSQHSTTADEQRDIYRTVTINQLHTPPPFHNN